MKGEHLFKDELNQHQDQGRELIARSFCFFSGQPVYYLTVTSYFHFIIP